MMIANELEQILQLMYEEASESHYEMVGLEHLLLALTEHSDIVRYVLQQCGTNVDDLTAQLLNTIQELTPTLAMPTSPQPTLGFQRVMQRAMIHVQQADKNEVFPLIFWWHYSAKPKAMRFISWNSKASHAVKFCVTLHMVLAQMTTTARFHITNLMATKKKASLIMTHWKPTPPTSMPKYKQVA